MFFSRSKFSQTYFAHLKKYLTTHLTSESNDSLCVRKMESGFIHENFKKMCTSFCHHVYFREGDTVLPMMISVMILLRVLTMKRSNWTSLDTRVNFPVYALVLPASFVISVK